MKTRILVCCHNRDIHASDYPYFPIQVGKVSSSLDLGIQGDDTGDNISAKNDCYCELTGMYWAWKNLKDADVVGLCHYRRYFDFHHQCQPVKPYTSFSPADFSKKDLSVPDEIIGKVADGAVVMAKGRSYRHNNMTEYCICHNSDDYRVLRQVIKETQSAVF